MMKIVGLLVMLLPITGFAQPLNTPLNPDPASYQNPSQQRLQAQMQAQQIQQQGTLKQQMQTQSRLQQQQLQRQLNTHLQRTLQAQPGIKAEDGRLNHPSSLPPQSYPED